MQSKDNHKNKITLEIRDEQCSQKQKQQEGAQYGSQDMNSSSFQQESEDIQDQQQQIRQRKAFYIPQVQQMVDNDQMQEQQMEAFKYLHTVRSQALNIKQENRKRKQIYRQNRRMENKNKNKCLNLASMTNQILKNSDSKQEQNKDWFICWQEQLFNNWTCIVQNIKYLNTSIMNKSSCKKIIKQAPIQMLSTKPKIYSLVTLPLGLIQQLISNLSDEYYFIITNNGVESVRNGKYYYYVWIYSLLALHRSLAQYQIFEGIASVNACILADIQNRKLNTNMNNNNINSCQPGLQQLLVVCCLLYKQFSQLNMGHLLWSIAKKIKDIY